MTRHGAALPLQKRALANREGLKFAPFSGHFWIILVEQAPRNNEKRTVKSKQCSFKRSARASCRHTGNYHWPHKTDIRCLPEPSWHWRGRTPWVKMLCSGWKKGGPLQGSTGICSDHCLFQQKCAPRMGGQRFEPIKVFGEYPTTNHQQTVRASPAVTLPMQHWKMLKRCDGPQEDLLVF